jgi:hypothetical protein
MSTQSVIAKMLKENTGQHFLDSGGAYGRNWEKNQTRRFDSEPATIMSIDQHDISITHNVYHFLKENVSYSAEWTAMFNRFAKRSENRDEGWLALMEDFADKYGTEKYTVNTYNGNDLLSQVLQYTAFIAAHEWVYLIQIHGGCDVRGGYTAPKAFTGDEYVLARNADASIYCQRETRQLTLTGDEDEPHYWNTDDGYHFYYQGACGFGAGTQLEAYERKQIETRDEWTPGTLCYFDDGRGLCPKCGTDLVAGF